MNAKMIGSKPASAVLRALGSFDPEAHHRNPVKGYVYNFIFVPRR